MDDTTATASSPLSLSPNPSHPSRWITGRSAVLGSLMVCLVCGLTPYNDWVVANTPAIGSYLPLVLILTFFALVVLVNGPLHRWAPRWALSSGELAVAMAMTLVSCSLPTQGMMRNLLPTLVSPFYHAAQNERFLQTLTGMHLPAWLFPVGDAGDPYRSPIVLNFYNRVQPGEPIPYGAWVIPLAGWGVFIFALLGSLMAISVLVRRQWAVSERLSFPLAQVQLALIESPRPGRLFNDLFSTRIFWLALGTVVLVHLLSGLNRYFPRTIPSIPLTYDLTMVMSNEPLVYLPACIKTATVYFTFIGISYFIQSRINFSLWACVLLMGVISVHAGMRQAEIPYQAWMDQQLGATIAFLAGMLWIGRQHWKLVVSQTLGRRDPDGHRPYRVPMLVLLGCIAVMQAWLLCLGVQAWVALMIVVFLLAAHLTVARVVAETGLPFIRAYCTPLQVCTNLPPGSFTGRDMFFVGAFSLNGAWTTRESLLPFALHAEQVAASTDPPPLQQRGLMALMLWALVLGFVVSAASSLHCYYTYAMPLSRQTQTVLNDTVLETWTNVQIVEPVTQWSEGHFPPHQHNPWWHMSIGAGVTSVLQVATLRWAAWPLLPVGYLLCNTWYVQTAWFSLFLGWLCKMLLLRFGGAGMYRRAKPFFLGIIFGEALAAGLWALVSLLLALLGQDYQVIYLLPP